MTLFPLIPSFASSDHSDCDASRGAYGASVPQLVLFQCCFWGLASLVSIGCVPQKDSEVVLYSASDREFATPILDAFERGSSAPQVTRQFDVEASKTLGLVTRIEQEKSRPRCDVFWNNEILHTIRLQKKGLLQSRRWAVPDNWPSNYRAQNGSWIGFAARARVLLINKTKLSDPATWPTSVLDLADSKWLYRCGLAYPIYGTTATHMAVLASHSEKVRLQKNAFSASAENDRKFQWNAWSKQVANNAVVLAGNKQVALAVSRGELDWGLTDTDDAVIELEAGHPVEIIFPDQYESGFGTLFVPNSVCVIRGAPHPTAAAALADYLISENVESRLTMGNSAQFPVWPNAKEKPRLVKDRTIRWAEVDFEKAAENWDATLEQLRNNFQK